MEENQKKKSSGGGFAVGLMIICLIAMTIMAVFIWNLICARQADAEKINQLTNRVSALNDNIDKLSASILKERSDQKDEKTSEPKQEATFAEAEIKTALLNYLELYGDSKCSGVLNNLKSKNVLPSFESNGVFDDTWTKTTLKYSDYKKAMLNFVSEKEYERYWESGIETFKETEDGYLAFSQGGGDRPNYEITSITNTSDNNYTANINYWMVDYNTDGETISHSFTVTSYNGKCVIDTIDVAKDSKV